MPTFLVAKKKKKRYSKNLLGTYAFTVFKVSLKDIKCQEF